MADITEVVSVSVTVEDASPSVANFGTIAIVAGDGPGLAGTWQGTFDASPSGLAGMIAAGFNINGGAYNKAQAICAQQPRTDKFKIFKRTTPNVDTKTITVTKTTPGFRQTFDISAGNGAFTSISYTNGNAETTTTIATALELLIEAVTGVASSSALGVITVTAETSGDRLYFRNMVRELTLKDTSTDAGIASDLAIAANADPDFFGVVIDGEGTLEIQAAAGWAESNARIFLAMTADSDVVTNSTTDVGSVLKAASRVFTGVMFSRDFKSAGEACLLGRQLSRDPGSSTFANKRLSGPAADNLNSTELGFLRAKNVIPFVTIKGLAITLDGKAAGGRYLDITHGVEWLKARMGERVFAKIVNEEKVNFTQAGIDELEAEIRAIMVTAETAGFFAPGWTVTMPKIGDVPPSDKANRILADIKFSAVLAGAIHKVVIDGTVEV